MRSHYPNYSLIKTNSVQGTNGLGRQAILDLIPHSPKHIYFTGRNAKAAKAVTVQMKAIAPSVGLTFIECDQSSLVSVHKAGKEFLSKSFRLDVLICCAGIMATPPALTKDGYEEHFGVNHLAHGLLTKLLLPVLEETVKNNGEARIVFVTSAGYMYSFPGGIVFSQLKTTQDFGDMSKWTRYGQSKLANVLYAAEIARRYPNILSVSVHPGATKTDLINRLSPDDITLVNQANEKIYEVYEGAYGICWCATAEKNEVKNGEVYWPVHELGQHTKETKDLELAKQLWEWTQEQIKEYN